MENEIGPNIGYEKDHNLNYGIAFNKLTAAIENELLSINPTNFGPTTVIKIKSGIKALHGKIIAGMYDKTYETEFTKKMEEWDSQNKIANWAGQQKKDLDIYKAIDQLTDIYVFQETQMKKLGLTGRREVCVINGKNPNETIEDYIKQEGDEEYKNEGKK